MHLGDLTWHQAEALGAAQGVLLIPIGSTEQHGPHLPLSTDTAIAGAIAGKVCERVEGIVVAPALTYGSSGEHQDFAGTISIGAAVTGQVIVELVRSAVHTFPHTVLISTHGGNSGPVSTAAAVLSREGHRVLVWTPSWGGDAHAGWTETSLMLAIDPTRVSLHLGRRGNVRELKLLMPSLRNHGVRSLSPNGVLGDPSAASASDGERLLSAAVQDLVTAISAFRAEESCP